MSLGSVTASPHLPHQPPRQEALQLPGPHRAPELADGLCLHLPHALAGHFEDASDFFEGVGVAVADAVPQLDDLPLAVSQRLEYLLDLVLQHLLRRRLHRVVGLLVLDEVAEVAVLALAHGAVQRDRVPADLPNPYVPDSLRRME